MRASRVSIAGLMLAVVAIGLGLAALARPSETVAKATFTVALASLSVALLGLIHARGTRRAAWSGYLVVAGGYLAISLGPWLNDFIGPQLITSCILDLAYDRLEYRPTQEGERVWGHSGIGWRGDCNFTLQTAEDGKPGLCVFVSGGGPYAYDAKNLRCFGPETMQRLGHSVCAVMSGLIGSVLALLISGRERQDPRPVPIGVDRPIDGGL